MLPHASSALLRFSNALRVHGLAGTLYRACRYPLVRILSMRRRRRIFSSTDTASVFTQIYESNWWGSEESVSGTGSTLAYTENIRAELPLLFEKFGIRSVFDAPCGDFNWMRCVVESCDIDYIGGDIVPQLIAKNVSRFAGERIRFSVANIISDEFPKVDLWICRDCLIHFSFGDIYSTLANFANSDIRYLLTTTHINKSGFKNMDIQTGDARLIDLFSAPFFLPTNYLYAIDDWVGPEVPRMMVLFNRAQVAEALPKMRAALGVHSANTA